MAIEATRFLGCLKRIGIDVVVGVPCSMIKGTIAAIDRDPEITYLGAANEGAALGLACGAALGGRLTCVVLQDSGFGNLINPLTSLGMTYGLGCLLVVSHHDPERDEDQHREMAALVRPILETLALPTYSLTASGGDFLEQEPQVAESLRSGQSVALLVARGGLTGGAPQAGPVEGAPALPRNRAIEVVLDAVPESSPVVSTTGFISRALHRHRDRANNFYMLGSMGHAGAVGLGLAISSRARDPVVVLDGDGAVMMHLGTLSTIGQHEDLPLLHIVLDNGVYESTGGQPSGSAAIALAEVARAAGYRAAVTCRSEGQLLDAVETLRRGALPAMIVAKVAAGSGEALPSVLKSLSPRQIVGRFRRSLESERSSDFDREQGDAGLG